MRRTPGSNSQLLLERDLGLCGSGSEPFFVSFEKNQVRQYLFADNAPGSQFDVRPLHPFVFGRTLRRGTFERQDCIEKSLLLARGKRLEQR